MTELRFESVEVSYGRDAVVHGVDLTVPSGQVLGLVGESGSGKSTVARAAAGLAPVTAGRIRLGELDLTRCKGRKPGLQMVFQDPFSSLNPRMTVGASIAEAVPKGTPRSARAREVARMLELVGLEADQAGVRPGRLSGGQRQRVAIARALAARPEVVIADEVTSALDVSVQSSILNLLRKLQAETGLSLLFISHDISVVRYLSDRIAVIRQGRIVESGPAADILRDPRDPYTAELIRTARESEVG